MAGLRDDLRLRAVALGAVVGAMWLLYIVDLVVPGGGSVIGHGIVPRTLAGLTGIPVAPLIHAGLQHLAANTVPLLILGGLVLLRGVREFLFVVLLSVLVAGAGTWLFGSGNAQHIGASGIVFGLFGYLVLRAAFDRRISSAVLALLVIVIYGVAMLRSLIPADGISWTAHFFGFLGGFSAARLRHPKSAITAEARYRSAASDYS